VLHWVGSRKLLQHGFIKPAILLYCGGEFVTQLLKAGVPGSVGNGIDFVLFVLQDFLAFNPAQALLQL
jgi:hypothetical protein